MTLMTLTFMTGLMGKFSIEVQKSEGFRLNNLYLKTPRGLGASSPHVLSYVKKFNEQCKKTKRGDRCLPRNNYICIAMYKQIKICIFVLKRGILPFLRGRLLSE